MSYESTPIGEWTNSHWIEFYHYLETVLNYSPEHGDGIRHDNRFHGFFWCCRRGWEDNIRHYNDNVVYLQIHSDRGYVAFRVEVQDVPFRSNIRDECSIIIRRKIQEIGRHEIIAPPPRRGVGKTMAFARVEQENWLGRNGETIDTVRVVNVLRGYENILEECFARQ